MDTSRLVCQLPPELDEDALSEDIAGAANPAVREHLAACPYCMARREHLAVTLALFERRLRDGLHRRRCPSPETLYDYVARTLDGVTHGQVAAHVRGCPRCTEDVGWLRDGAVAAPRPGSARSRLRRWVSRLLPARPEVALRGDSDIRWRAQFPGGQLFVELGPLEQPTRWLLSGQLLPEPPDDSWAGALVELRVTGQLLAALVLDDLLEFQIETETITTSTMALTITSLDGRVIEIHQNVDSQ
jgi:Putative zinc-finger